MYRGPVWLRKVVKKAPSRYASSVRQPKHSVFGEKNSECFRWFSPHVLYNFPHLKNNIIRDLFLLTCVKKYFAERSAWTESN